MSEAQSKALRRVTQVGNFLTPAPNAPWDPNWESFPTRKELANIPGAPPGASWFWGNDDNKGRINLLTPKRVKAGSAEISTGEIIPLNLPLDVPKVPGFGREAFQHEIIDKYHGKVFDDKYNLNTQSSTQWDGFRHFSHLPTGLFYNGTTAKDIKGPNANLKCSIHHWSEHGVAGRGILLDYRTYAAEQGIQYDPLERYEISWDELSACGKAQGIDIRPEAQGGDIKIGDLLFIRSGLTEAYNNSTPEERAKATSRPNIRGKNNKQRWAGVQQEEKMLDWLHDCYFAAVAGDGPSFEAWPSQEDWSLHEYLLALWGCPIGEFFDLERLSKKCKELNKWTFFATSSPANCPGGVASHANALAIV